MKKDIAWLEEIRKGDVGIVGGKGANLGELVNAGFPVPPAFIVTSQAYFSFLDEANIRDTINKEIGAIDVENTEQLNGTTEKIRQLILASKMPEALDIEIRKAYAKMCSRRLGLGLTSSEDEYVAVRSSATAEDLPSASFAGQQETYLNVLGGKDLVEKVKMCWASLFTARATYYRKRQGFETSQVGIAVVVQKMVNSETAGVMFTADPASGEDDVIVIEAAYGLGEVVVSGAVTPDTYRVDKKTLAIAQKKMSEQEWMLERAGRGSKKADVPQKKRSLQKISDEEIVKLAEIGRRIEQHYGSPQDIEWAVEAKKTYIVQARAITTIKGMKEKEKERGAKRAAAVKGGARELIHGLSASPGVAAGKARVIPYVGEIGRVEKGDIIVTKMTSPDWVPAMEKSIAIITDEGGTTCHAAIVSRELGIPCIVGTVNATAIIRDGQEITVDGYEGKVYEGAAKLDAKAKKAGPAVTDAELDEMASKLAVIVKAGNATDLLGDSFGEAKELAAELNSEGKRGAKGNEEAVARIAGVLHSVCPKVKVNVALTDAAENASKTGADGVGLLRAEHMITSSGKHPAEFIRRGEGAELVKVAKAGVGKVAGLFSGKPVWYRTFDARTDEFRNMEGGGKEPKEDNPMLGWHGIRRDLDEPEMLRAQFCAIRELVDEGYDNVGVMLPFVQSAEELRIAKKIAGECGLKPGAGGVQFGIMVETPAAVWSIDEMLAEGIDFASFGTNDLTQLTLGIDRNNERIQKWFTELHPAILRQLQYVIVKCRERGVETSICGQAGSNKDMVRLLVRFGISSVSANIDAVAKMRKAVVMEGLEVLLERIAEAPAAGTQGGESAEAAQSGGEEEEIHSAPEEAGWAAPEGGAESPPVEGEIWPQGVG
ncbi:MAG: phosphoenolpyruvate synthase [Candidatus Diapherotrites archaeon]